MSGIAIYMEGGGDSVSTKAQLRSGMDEFLRELKALAREKSMRWKLVPVGGRDKAFDRFHSRPPEAEYPIRVLLVDAEAPVTAANKRVHLKSRDGWDLSTASESSVHLMCQTMEAWIVADPDALAGYYDARFKREALPKADNLETVSKQDVNSALKRATQNTQKGAYQKIRHASELLAKLDTAKVKKRCPRCSTLFSDLADAISSA